MTVKAARILKRMQAMYTRLGTMMKNAEAALSEDGAPAKKGGPAAKKVAAKKVAAKKAGPAAKKAAAKKVAAKKVAAKKVAAKKVAAKKGAAKKVAAKKGAARKVIDDSDFPDVD